MGTDLVKPSKVTVATSDGTNFATKHGDFSWNLAAINRDLVEIYTLVDIQKTMENHCYSWANQLFLWPFSIAMLVYQRVPVMETSLENWGETRERIETTWKTCKTSQQILEKGWGANSTLMNSEQFEMMLGNHWEQH